MTKLTTKEWKDLEKQYPVFVRTIYRPPLWSIGEMMTKEKYDFIIAEISLLEQKKSEFQCLGYTKTDESIIEWYLSEDKKLYTYLYNPKVIVMDGNEDDEDYDLDKMDIIETNEFECRLISICEEKIKSEEC